MFAAGKTASVSGSAPDAQFNYVTMLLHGDGTNGAQNNTFLDSSTNNFTITRNGNTTQGSFSPYGSNWSNFFGGSDYLSLADNANLNPSTQDFVMEAWVYLTGTTGNNQGINGKGTAGTDGYTLFVTNALVLSFVWNGTGGATITGGTLVLNTWNHVAVVRNSSVIRLYLNGVGAGSSTACTTDITSTATKFVGQARGGNPILGYMSNYRMTKGSLPSGYDATSSTLTVPTAPLTAISGTSLLTCKSNRFIDNSASPLTITVNGTPSVQRFNPFGASTAYSTSVIGGSGYFDGTGDFLQSGNEASLEIGTGNFTIEMWAYRLSGTNNGLFQLSTTAGGFKANDANNLALAFASGGLTYYANNNSYAPSVTVNSNDWNHLALVRSGTTTTLYFNGVSVSSITDSTNYTGTYLVVGGYYSTTYVWNGYISNFRIVKGTAVYTSAFTPPTAPVTAITNTQLLLNYTNGAIFDNAMMNDLETVGNAQISTSVVKYGTGSIALDGTGDYLKFVPGVNSALGTGNFTVEGWFYITNNLTDVYFFDTRNASQTSNCWGGGYGLGGTSGRLSFFIGAGSVQTSGSVGSLNTWMHIAFVRVSGTLTIYLNGTSVASGSLTNDASTVSTLGYIGTRYTQTFDYGGYMDDLRITKGYARYTANFSVPTAAFPDIGPV
jgi:hypothetical protein